MRARVVVVQQRRRRLLDDLLVAPLQAAFTLAEVDDVAVAVGEHLHLDVAGVQHISLEEQRVIAERGGRLAARTGQRGGQVGRLAHDPHALAAAAGRRLDQHRIADVVGRGDQVGIGQARPARPGTTGTPNADTAAFAAILSPIVWIAATGGPMNTMPADCRAAANSAFSERNP